MRSRYAEAVKPGSTQRDPGGGHPKRAARVITTALTDDTNETGVYHDEAGRPMLGSRLVRDPAFQDRVVAETRALHATG